MIEKYFNNAEVEASIVDPITKTISVYPVKDAYLSQSEPLWPHGVQKHLYVNNSSIESQYGNKIIMAFDMPTLKDTQYENLIAVKLVLQAPTIPTRDIELGLKYHIDNGWIEDGTTWMGQPQDDSEYIMTKIMSYDARTISFDITDIFTSHNNTEFHLPLTILEKEANVDSKIVQFYSREAGTRFSPVINITYAYFAESMDTRKLDGRIVVRRNVPDNNVNPPIEAPELPGVLDINGGYTRSHLDGRITIKTINVPDPNADPPVEAPDLEGQVKVRRTIHHVIPEAKVIIRQNKEKNLDGQIDVNLYITRPGSPKLDDPPKRLLTDGRWVQPLWTPYLPGIIDMKTFNVPDPNADPPVEAPDLEGQLNIIAKFDLNGSLMIPRYHANLNPEPAENIKPSAYDGKPNVEDTYVHYHAMNGNITVRRYVPDYNVDPPIEPPDFNGQMDIIEWYATLDPSETLPSTLDGTYEGKPRRYAKYTHAADLDASVNINGTSGINGQMDIVEWYATLDRSVVLPSTLDGTYEGKPRRYAKYTHAADLDGMIRINIDEDLNGQMDIVEWYATLDPSETLPSTLDGTYEGKPRRYAKYTHAADLDGQLIIAEEARLEGSITIREYFVPDPNADPPVEAPDLESHVLVVGHRYSDIEGRLIINEDIDLSGKVTLRNRKFKDIEGKIYIDDAASGAYAFIIV